MSSRAGGAEGGRLKDRLQRILERAGYHLVRYPQPPCAVAALRRIVAEEEIDLVIDVGAHRGEFGRLMRGAVGYAGAMISFEPNPECFAELEAAAVADGAWTAVPAAAGETPGRLALRVTERTTFSSFLEPHPDVDEAFVPSVTPRGEVEVPVVRLDEEVPRLLADALDRRILLKTDAQGYDHRVLRGSEALFPAIRGIQTELAVQPMYEGAPPYHGVLAELEARGFVPVEFCTVAKAQGHIVEMDALLVRERSLSEAHGTRST